MHRPAPALRIAVADESQPGEARRAAVSFADRLGFSETERGEIAIVVTELATNLVKHTTSGGELLIRAIDETALSGLEIISLDRGPGMASVARCLSDGYSTAGSPGNGFGAISRLSDVFEIHSSLDSGTAILTQFSPRQQNNNPTGRLKLGVVNLPKLGEEACGDAWFVNESERHRRILVVDGLGHGFAASEAASEAVRIFRERNELTLTDLVRAIHEALRSTRGAALAIAEFDSERLRFVGIGNIAASIHHPDGLRQQSLVSHNGTVGHQMRKIQEFEYSWNDEASLIMHSDGLSTQWRLESYSGLSSSHPGLVAGVLYRDFVRGKDDVTVVAARLQREAKA